VIEKYLGYERRSAAAMRFGNGVGAYDARRRSWRRPAESRFLAPGGARNDKELKLTAFGMTKSWGARRSERQRAGLMHGGGGIVDCGAELSYGPGDFFFGDYGGWG
jgi:hypothetical protein